MPGLIASAREAVWEVLLESGWHEMTPPDVQDALSVAFHAGESSCKFSALRGNCVVEYEVNFQRMIQKNISLGTERQIRLQRVESEKQNVQCRSPQDFYTGVAIKHSLQQDWVHFLKAEYVVEQDDQGKRMQRYQDMTFEAFISPELIPEVIREPGPPVFYHIRIFVLSYRWLQRGNPDPQGHHLTIVARVMRLAIAREVKGDRDSPIVLFWDFPCLPQHPRTSSEELKFRKGLGSCDILYGHQETFLLMQPRLPEAFQGSSYFDSGWCFFESSASSITKRSGMILDLARDDGSATTYLKLKDACFGSRKPPISPDRFDNSISSKVFATTTDPANVSILFRRTFDALASRCKELNFANLSWGPDELYQLLEVLPHFSQCQKLSMYNNPIGDEGGAALLNAVKTRHMLPVLELLRIGGIKGGEKALKAKTELMEMRPALQITGDMLVDWAGNRVATPSGKSFCAVQ